MCKKTLKSYGMRGNVDVQKQIGYFDEQKICITSAKTAIKCVLDQWFNLNF